MQYLVLCENYEILINYQINSGVSAEWAGFGFTNNTQGNITSLGNSSGTSNYEQIATIQFPTNSQRYLFIADSLSRMTPTYLWDPSESLYYNYSFSITGNNSVSNCSVENVQINSTKQTSFYNPSKLYRFTIQTFCVDIWYINEVKIKKYITTTPSISITTTTNFTNQYIQNNTITTFNVTTPFSPGSYKWEIECNNTANTITNTSEQRIIVIGTPSISFALSSGISAIKFVVNYGANEIINCTSQNSTLGALNATNNGTIVGDLQCKVSALVTGLTLAMDKLNSFLTEINLTTTYQSINNSVDYDQSEMLWIREYHNTSLSGPAAYNILCDVV